jgi:hypothetical protein
MNLKIETAEQVLTPPRHVLVMLIFLKTSASAICSINSIQISELVSQFLLKINLEFLLRKIGASLNFNFKLGSLHVSPEEKVTIATVVKCTFLYSKKYDLGHR